MMPAPQGWQQSDVTVHPGSKNGMQGTMVVVVETHNPSRRDCSAGRRGPPHTGAAARRCFRHRGLRAPRRTRTSSHPERAHTWRRWTAPSTRPRSVAPARPDAEGGWSWAAGGCAVGGDTDADVDARLVHAGVVGATVPIVAVGIGLTHLPRQCRAAGRCDRRRRAARWASPSSGGAPGGLTSPGTRERHPALPRRSLWDRL